MTETSLPPLEPPRRFHFDWVMPALFRPRRVFARLADYHGSAWLTPILLLLGAALLRVVVAGGLRAQNAGAVELPPGSEWWTPEQQAQYFQTAQATTGPTFVYVFPALQAAATVVLGWLIVGGVLHLALTLLGGRSSGPAALNYVAWAGLPFVLREVVAAGAMLATGQLIDGPGLAGFTPPDLGPAGVYLYQVLSLIDLYLIWHIGLLVIGGGAVASLPARRALAGVSVTMAVLLLLQALPGFVAVQLGAMQIIRMF